MWIKLIGALCVVTASGMVGLSRAARLSRRAGCLAELTVAAAEVGNRILLGRDTLEPLLQTALPRNITWRDGRLTIDPQTGLDTKDRTLVAEWLEGLGLADASTDKERCDTYAALFKERMEAARVERDEKKKLYQIGGFSIGLALSLICW